MERHQVVLRSLDSQGHTSLRTWEGVLNTDTVFTRWLWHILRLWIQFHKNPPLSPSHSKRLRAVYCVLSHWLCVVFIHFNNHGVVQSDSSVVLLSYTFTERVGVLSVQTCR